MGKKRILLVYHILFSVLTVPVGIAFAAQAFLTYRAGVSSGGQIYSAAIISERFFKILPLLIVWGVVLIFGIVYVSFFSEAAKTKTRVPLHMKEEMLSERISEETDELRSLRKKRKTAFLCAVGAVAVLCIPPLIYLSDLSHFTTDSINRSVKAASLFSLPFVAGMALVAVVYVLYRDRRTEELIALEKTLPKTQKKTKKKNAKVLLSARVLLACLALTLIVLGWNNGSADEVLRKAKNICTECIGLG